jgi:hypothetical protein
MITFDCRHAGVFRAPAFFYLQEVKMQTPCDVLKDDNGHSVCPYEDTYCGYASEMCRNMCGLGVDENPYPEEDYDLDPFSFEEEEDEEESDELLETVNA